MVHSHVGDGPNDPWVDAPLPDDVTLLTELQHMVHQGLWQLFVRRHNDNKAAHTCRAPRRTTQRGTRQTSISVDTHRNNLSYHQASRASDGHNSVLCSANRLWGEWLFGPHAAAKQQNVTMHKSFLPPNYRYVSDDLTTAAALSSALPPDCSTSLSGTLSSQRQCCSQACPPCAPALTRCTG